MKKPAVMFSILLLIASGFSVQLQAYNLADDIMYKVFGVKPGKSPSKKSESENYQDKYKKDKYLISYDTICSNAIVIDVPVVQQDGWKCGFYTFVNSEIVERSKKLHMFLRELNDKTEIKKRVGHLIKLLCEEGWGVIQLKAENIDFFGMSDVEMRLLNRYLAWKNIDLGKEKNISVYDLISKPSEKIISFKGELVDAIKKIGPKEKKIDKSYRKNKNKGVREYIGKSEYSRTVLIYKNGRFKMTEGAKEAFDAFERNKRETFAIVVDDTHFMIVRAEKMKNGKLALIVLDSLNPGIDMVETLMLKELAESLGYCIDFPKEADEPEGEDEFDF